MMTKTKLLGAAAVLLLSVGAAAAAPAVSRADLNVRSGPGTEYGVVGVIQAGETVDVGRLHRAAGARSHSTAAPAMPTAATCRSAGAPSAGVVVQAPVYDPYDYDYDYGYSYGPGVSFYAGPRFRHRHDGWRHGWHGWRGRSAGNWQGRGGDWQGPQLAGRRPARCQRMGRRHGTRRAAAGQRRSHRRWRARQRAGRACRRLRQRAPRHRARRRRLRLPAMRAVARAAVCLTGRRALIAEHASEDRIDVLEVDSRGRSSLRSRPR